ncbi:hypothetical protein DZK27_04700 [Rhodobacteraceae bacterium 63075]|nr:hypothetical protein DZK27_04700 [Rhodobacteraceae bacterium 63075]
MGQPLMLVGYLALGRIAPLFWRLAASAAHRKQGAQANRLTERFGKPTAPRPAGPLLWMHAESVGEVKGMAPLLRVLSAKAHILLTTNTQTGADQAEALDLSGLTHQFKPVDTLAASNSFLDHWQPDIALFAESDMPPGMLQMLGKRRIPKALIAARPSKTRSKAPRTAAALLEQFDLITASSGKVAEDIENLGAPVSVIEDLKAQQREPAAPLDWPEEQLRRPLWLAVSTHPEDHALLFAAQKAIMAQRPDALLAIAPRHPQQARTWAQCPLEHVFFSKGGVPDHSTHLFVMDAFGHLPRLHAMSHVSFIGGALGERGGHSPWEAAAAGSVILTGPDLSNNAPAYAQIPHQIVDDAASLSEAVLAAWQTPRPAPALPDTAQGATARAVFALLEQQR